ncbi:hypothetical protein RUM43_009738 [Polyplax serrata]|uniref:Uncharacterized protein n=1 Tax=Polyplax serrata TaxID=468196 RepID=A0AAN8S6V5_POLSC
MLETKEHLGGCVFRGLKWFKRRDSVLVRAVTAILNVWHLIISSGQCVPIPQGDKQVGTTLGLFTWG